MDACQIVLYMRVLFSMHASMTKIVGEFSGLVYTVKSGKRASYFQALTNRSTLATQTPNYNLSSKMQYNVQANEKSSSCSVFTWPKIFHQFRLKVHVKARQPIAVSDISIYICLINIRSKSKEQLNERRAGLSRKMDWTGL